MYSIPKRFFDPGHVAQVARNVVRMALRKSAQPGQYLRYRYTLATGKPYFGPILGAGQIWPVRQRWMSATAVEAMNRTKGPFKILEVGTWAGSSAVLWAKLLEEHHRGNGSVLCVDSWRPYVDPTVNVGCSQSIVRMNMELAKDRIFGLFQHNVRSSGCSQFIQWKRGQSSAILPQLEPESFDMIYIDGSHFYADVVDDLRSAKRLLKPGGLLCGDDLEAQIHEVDEAYARENRERDFVTDRSSGKSFHPGVALAVSEVLGPVKVNDGFWHVPQS